MRSDLTLPRLVLRLCTPQGRLKRHHPLSLRRQNTLFTNTIPVGAVSLVALQPYLQPVVAAPGTVRGGTRALGTAAGGRRGPQDVGSSTFVAHLAAVLRHDSTTQH